MDRFYGSPKFDCFHSIVDGHQPNIRVLNCIYIYTYIYILPPLFPIKGGMTIPNIRS